MYYLMTYVSLNNLDIRPISNNSSNKGILDNKTKKSKYKDV